MIFKGSITAANTAAQGAESNGDERLILKNCAPFTNCIRRITSTQENAHDIDVVMPMYKLIEYSDNVSETSGILRQCCRDDQFLDANNAISDFNAANVSTSSFKSKEKVTG